MPTTIRLNVPDHLCEVLDPVFESLPPSRAMQRLTPEAPLTGVPAEAVTRAVATPVLQEHPALQAGLWLYVDDLDASHTVSQQIATPTGAYWHAIMHRREADFENSKYWYRKAGNHPAFRRIDLTGGGAGSGTDVARYEPDVFVDRVAKAHDRSGPDAGLDGEHPELTSLQWREWRALFEFCAEQ